MNNTRYIVQILFKETVRKYYLIRQWDIFEEFKTLKEAQQYKSLVDDSVDKARVVDRVNDTVVEIWK